MHAIMCYIDIVNSYSYSMTCAQYLHHSCSGFSHSQTIEMHSRLQWEIFHLSKLAIFELLQQTSGHAACSTAAPRTQIPSIFIGTEAEVKGRRYSNILPIF